jgi:hypothetical protein
MPNAAGHGFEASFEGILFLSVNVHMTVIIASQCDDVEESSLSQELHTNFPR